MLGFEFQFVFFFNERISGYLFLDNKLHTVQIKLNHCSTLEYIKCFYRYTADKRILFKSCLNNLHFNSKGEEITNDASAVPDGKDAMSIFNSAPKSGKDVSTNTPHFTVFPLARRLLLLCNVFYFVPLFFLSIAEESGQDDAAAKANPSLTREKDLVVNISDLDNIFDEDEEELGVRHNLLFLTIVDLTIIGRPTNNSVKHIYS